MARRRYLIPLALLALTACGASHQDASVSLTPPTTRVEAASSSALDTTDGQIAAMDLAWSPDKTCPLVRLSFQSGPLTSEERDFVIRNFEKGFGHTLTEEAANHLVHLVEACQ